MRRSAAKVTSIGLTVPLLVGSSVALPSLGPLTVSFIEFGKDVKSVRAEEAARRNGVVLGSRSAAQSAEG